MSNKVVKIITDKIISELEKGNVSWQQGWADKFQANYISQKPYRGLNQWLLQIEAKEQGYNSDLWLTYKQAKQSGGYVKQGEQGTPIAYYGKVYTDDDEEEVAFSFLRYYRVFNTDQTEDLDLPEPKEETKPQADKLISDYLTREQIELVRGGNKASYNPKTDKIYLPSVGKFNTASGKYSTLFHEAIHSTGHKTRLNRWADNTFGSNDYSVEELIAEIGSAMLAVRTGIKVDYQNTAGYIDNWLKALKNNRDWIIKAGWKSQKALDFIDTKLAVD
jgi:antirestriction protein ArdC